MHLLNLLLDELLIVKCAGQSCDTLAAGKKSAGPNGEEPAGPDAGAAQPKRGGGKKKSSSKPPPSPGETELDKHSMTELLASQAMIEATIRGLEKDRNEIDARHVGPHAAAQAAKVKQVADLNAKIKIEKKHLADLNAYIAKRKQLEDDVAAAARDAQEGGESI